MFFTLDQLHARDFNEVYLVSIFKIVFRTVQQFNKTLLITANRLNIARGQLFTILVQDIKAIPEVIEEAAEHTNHISADELLAVLVAEVVDSDDGVVSCLSQNDDIVEVEVPRFGLKFSLCQWNGFVGRLFALDIQVELLKTIETSFDSILANVVFAEEELA